MTRPLVMLLALLAFPAVSLAQAGASKPLAFTRLFAAGASQGGKLAEPSKEFSPDEKTIHVRFAYEGGVAGEELRSRWVFVGPAGPQELAQSVVRLRKVSDLGQFSFSPAEGARWQEGAYHVEIIGRGTVLARVEFAVRQAGAAVPAPPPAPAGPVNVLNAVLAKDVGQGQPKDPVTEFSTARKRLILWAHVEAPGGSAPLTARWYATDGGDRLLGEHTLAVPAGESRLAYWLEVADDKTKFTRGRFRVDLVAGSQTLKQVPFRIRQAGFFEEVGEAFEQLGRELDKAIAGSGPAPAPAPEPQVASAPPAASAPGTKRFTDPAFGIEFELPEAWGYRVTQSKDYLFEGPQGTDAYELSMVIQFVSKAKNPGSSAAAQAQGLVRQIQGAPDGKLVTSDTAAIAGQPAPYFVASYTAPDSRKMATAFAHTQIVMDHGAYYYLLSYSGPAPIYQKHLATFQHVVETFRFVK